MYLFVNVPLYTTTKTQFDTFMQKQSEYCILSNNIYDYHVVSQGKTTIPSVDDAEEFEMTDVRKYASGFFQNWLLNQNRNLSIM